MTPPTHGPIASRRKLTAALRRAREEAGLTQQQVADAMEWSLSKLIRIENGLVGISVTDLRALLHHYSVADPAAMGKYMELARSGRKRPWWHQYPKELTPPQFVTLLGLESEASRLWVFTTSLLPGLLQTERYAYAVLRANRPEAGEEELQAGVALRLRRQNEVFNRRQPPRVQAILDEAGLHRMPDEKGVARGQLRHLLELADSRPLTIRVVPFSAGVYLLASPFFIMSFDSPDESDVVYIESARDQALITEPGRVGDYHLAFETIAKNALSPDQSTRMITEILDQM